MPKTKLSDLGLRSLQPPERGTVDWWDSALPSFGCRVSQGGAKTFILKVDNSRRAIGRFPIISLAEARTEAKRLLAEKTLGKVRPQSITYEQAVKVFLEEKGERRRSRTVADHKRHLGLLGFKGQLADVTHQDLERKLKRLPPSEFNHRLACAKTFFRWAQKKRYRQDDPTVGLSPHTRPSRSRVLSDAELQLIWRACEQSTVSPRKADLPSECTANAGLGGRRALPTHFATIVRLLILTGQRKGEIANLRADYFSCTTQSKSLSASSSLPGHSSRPDGSSTGLTNVDLCTLPPTLTKNGREHAFPLGAVSTAILTSLLTAGSTLLFPARGKTNAPFSGWSKAKSQLDKLSGVADWTLHDLRRTFATRLAELGVAPHVIERLLNHVTGSMSPIARVYNRATFLAEMRQAVDLWEVHVTKLLAR